MAAGGFLVYPAVGTGNPSVTALPNSKLSFQTGGSMVGFIIVSIISGVLLMVLDAIINANPYAQKVYEVYKPILKTTINLPLNLLIYLVNGFALAAFFVFLRPILPGEIGIVKGICFALIIWYFRSFMAVIFQWMMFPLPSKAMVYGAISGLCEILLVGVVYGLILR
jgi:CBS domain containing-hemolysin-like protein